MAKQKKIVIFGAGITGLAAARELLRLGHEVEVHEASAIVGGLAANFKDADGFVYDNGPRFIFSTLAEKLGILDECVPVKYYEDLYVDGRYYLFPFGFIRNPWFALSAGSAFLTRFLFPRPTSLGAFLKLYYGRYFSGKVLSPLIEKWSGVPSDKMSVDFASRLLPTSIRYILYSLLKKLRGGVTEDFYKKGRYIVYPKGSNSRIFDALLAAPGLSLHLHSPLEALQAEGERVTHAICGGKTITADYFISTISISTLAQVVKPTGLLDAFQPLHYRSIIILFVKIERERLLHGLWTWFPEEKYSFYRISEYKNALENMAPKGKTLISVEFACQTTDALWAKSKEELFDHIAGQLENLYGLRRSEVIGLDMHRSPAAYPVMKKDTEVLQRNITHTTPLHNLLLAGRTGMFQYKMTEGSYDSAIDCVRAVQALIDGKEISSTAGVATDSYGRPLVVHE